jgi:hypothetical protein
MKLPPIIHLFEVTADLCSGLRGRRRTYLTVLKRAWSSNFKMVWYVLLRLLRPEIDLSKVFKTIYMYSFEKRFETNSNCLNMKP